MTTRETLSQPKRLQKLDTLGWIVEIAKYFALIVLVISFTLPFFWMVTSALKDDSQVNTIPPVWFPSPAHWDNFPGAWGSYNFNLYMMNTIFRFALPSTLGVTVSSALVAYGFARLRWPGRDMLFSLCVATMMIPFAVTMVQLPPPDRAGPVWQPVFYLYAAPILQNHPGRVIRRRAH
jgi:ABC-type glycerol-3-phosphate transport system permease component